MGVEIYELDAAKFLSAPGLALPGALKKTKVKLELYNYINMLIMVEKGIRCGLCHSINRYAKVDKKYIKDYDKNEELWYLKRRDVRNLNRR